MLWGMETDVEAIRRLEAQMAEDELQREVDASKGAFAQDPNRRFQPDPAPAHGNSSLLNLLLQYAQALQAEEFMANKSAADEATKRRQADVAMQGRQPEFAEAAFRPNVAQTP